MIVILGESASGKSTLANYLVDNYLFDKVVTYTTRPMREGEKDGIDYNFISEQEFYELKNKNFFLETATYNGWHYGTSKDSMMETSDGNEKVVVLTPSGFRKLKAIRELNRKNLIPQTVLHSVYLYVSRRSRLIKLLERGDDIEEAYRRNLSDVGMFDGIENEVDIVIDNDWYEYNPTELARNLLGNL